MKVKVLTFEIRGDELGYLIPLEAGKNVPFDIKRTYFIFDIDTSDVRGKHAHKKLKQILICARGSCKVLFDDDQEKITVELNGPDKGVIIEPMVWHEMYEFSADCLLICLADNYYDESDYIRSYDEYRKLQRTARHA